ncbi:ubiquitin carboxyl-terminal hydrolase 2-like [Chenopodium quinoa]|nr:ubiquitin carboxyl-terminal hydrolase 2-like [Chenopodium quinoa]
MGKKVKKKAARNAHKEKEKEKEKDKRVSTSSPKAITHEDDQNSVAATDGSVQNQERTVCVHLDKAVDLESVSSKIEAAESTGCQDCREGVNDRKAGKGRGKHSKKKGASDSRANKATWICLQCGHFSCGGVGLPNSPQSHALRHAKQSRHPLVIQVENPHLRWCFPCSTLLPVDKVEATGEHKDFYLDIVKLLKKQSSKVPSVDVEDIWFGSGTVISEVKGESKAINVVNGKDFNAVRGLVNLGNTCFFNSVMQNLLAMDILRDNLLKFEGSTGPLMSALKKFFVESSPESGVKNVINPKSLFGCVCAKAPQFKGFQQQDSHELLRCLLDGLSSEDLHAKKLAGSSPGNGRSVPVNSTFVDAIFGGQTSSTVCCVECGHSSVVYEPFLDLSLSVPMKKPLSKKAQPVHRAKKTKLPPKRGGRNRPKLNKNEDLESAPGDCNTATSMDSSGLKDNMGPAPSGCNTSISTESSSGFYGGSPSYALSVDFVEPCNLVPRSTLMSQDSNSIKSDNDSAQLPHSVAQDADGMPWLDYHKPFPQSDDAQEADSFCWMDYVEPVSLSDDPNSVEKEGFSVTQDLGSHDGDHDTLSIHDTANSSFEASLSQVSAMEGDNHGVVSVLFTAKSVGDFSVHPENVHLKLESTVNDWVEEQPVQVQDNEILLLTYKEDGLMDGEEEMKVDAEVSSSAVVDGEDSLGFDGLGDLFNEPEDLVAGMNSVPVSDGLANGFLAGNSTESDPDEVDDTDSPVSVETCLAHFIKPELLSGEHAWHCENCTKLLKEGRQRMMENQQKTASVQRSKSSDVCLSSETMLAMNHHVSDSSAVSLAAHDNGSIKIDENLKKLDDGKINGPCPNLSQKEESRREPETTHLNASDPCVCSMPSDKTYLDGKSGDVHGPIERPSGPSEEHESGEVEEEEVDVKCVKVMRDATKRILISKTPPILTIHLKRFGQDARGRLSKLNGHVGFKEYINLGPYMDCRSTERDNCFYRLIGVVEHSGSMRGGHYVAYVRGGDRRRGRSEEENRRGLSVWYHASDSYIRETTLKEVLSCEAYILFYEKAKP